MKANDSYIGGATVNIDVYSNGNMIISISQLTDSAGTFKIPFDLSATYKLRILKEGYLDAITTITTRACAPPIMQIPHSFVTNYTYDEMNTSRIIMPEGVCNTSLPTSSVRESATILRAFSYERDDNLTRTVISTKLLFNGTQYIVVTDTIPDTFMDNQSEVTITTYPTANVSLKGLNVSLDFGKVKGAVEFNYTINKVQSEQYMAVLIRTIEHPMLFVGCMQPEVPVTPPTQPVQPPILTPILPPVEILAKCEQCLPVAIVILAVLVIYIVLRKIGVLSGVKHKGHHQKNTKERRRVS